jgi:hypothetical protein
MCSLVGISVNKGRAVLGCVQNLFNNKHLFQSHFLRATPCAVRNPAWRVPVFAKIQACDVESSDERALTKK